MLAEAALVFEIAEGLDDLVDAGFCLQDAFDGECVDVAEDLVFKLTKLPMEG